MYIFKIKNFYIYICIYIFFCFKIFAKKDDVFYYNEFCKNNIGEYFSKQKHKTLISKYKKNGLKKDFDKINLVKKTCENNIVNKILYYSSKNKKNSLFLLKKIDINKISNNLKTYIIFKEGIQLISEKKYLEGIAIFKKLKKQTTDDDLSHILDYYISFCYFNIGEYDKTINILSPIYNKKKTLKTEMAYLLIISLFYKGEIDKILYLEKILQNNNNKIICSIYGDIYTKKEQFEKAINYYKETLSVKWLNKNDIDILKIKTAFCFYKIGKQTQSRKILSKISKKNNNLGKIANFILGIILLEENSYEKALHHFQKNIKINTNNNNLDAETLFCEAICKIYLKKTNEAINILENFVKKYPKHNLSSEANSIIVNLNIPNYDFKNIIEYVEKHENVDKGLKKIYQKFNFENAVKYYNNNDYKKSLEFCKKALKYDSDSDIFHVTNFLCAEIYFYMKKYDMAITFYNKALSSHLSFLKNKVLYGIGYCYFMKKDYNKTLEIFTSKISQTKESDIKIRIADCYFFLKKYEKAINEYKTLTFNKKHSLYYLGLSYFYLKDIDNAKKYFSIIITKYPLSNFYKKAVNKYIDCLNNINICDIFNEKILNEKDIVNAINEKIKKNTNINEEITKILHEMCNI